MRFRVLIFLSLTCVVLLPLVGMTTWVTYDLLKRENDIVLDKHLTLAKHLSGTLEQYSSNLLNNFEMDVNLYRQNNRTDLPKSFPNWQEFNLLCAVNLKSGEMVGLITSQRTSCVEQVPMDLVQKFAKLVVDDKAVISPLLKNSQGEPTFYILRVYGDELFIGAVSTDYIVNQGEAISFGIKGHAAIVDQTGTIIAHPREAWRVAMKNLIDIAPVQMTLAKKTGITTFHSQAQNTEMVTGYTYVPSTGWGVMVPQPLTEIREATLKVRNSLIAISLVGLIASAFLSWYLSGYLTRTLSSVIQMAKKLADEDLEARVDLGRGVRPREIDELCIAFNSMASAIKARNAELGEKSKALLSTNLDLQQSTTQLKTALASAEKANLAKSEFLASMSHELRTPLTSSIGSIGLLASMTEGTLSPESQDLMEIAIRNNEALLRLINELLDFEKIISGHISLETSPHEIGHLTAEVVKNSLGLAQTQAVNFVYKEPPQPYFANVQEHRFEQILNNLLSNAAKFSEAGSDVEISVEQDNGNVVVKVKDYGIGLSETFKPHLFEQFTQADSSTTRNVGGTGLGLSISKALIEAMGGTIGFNTELNVGSTFFIVLPMVKQPGHSISHGEEAKGMERTT